MRPTRSNSSATGGLIATAVLLLGLGPATAQDAQPAEAPQNAELGAIVSSAISVSDRDAELELELAGGRELTLTFDEAGAIRLNGERIGGYEAGAELDRSWRALLNRAIDLPVDDLRLELIAWEPTDDGVAERLDRELESALSGADALPAPDVDAAQDRGPARDAGDSIGRLNERLRELEAELQELDESGIDIGISARELRREIEREIRREIEREIQRDMDFGGGWWNSPFRHIIRGVTGVFSTLMAYGILVGLGFLVVFFGRTYLERIADTARHATLRAGLVGLAGTFLFLPAFILGTLALAISIVGIPLLLVWVPLFPVALIATGALGYLGVAHGAGEALAERRFMGSDWFKRANSYYYVMSGVGLLLVLFLATHIVDMAGPWLDFLQGLLHFMAVVVTWAATTIGFGAVLLSRAGTRPPSASADSDLDTEFEESHA